MRTWSFALLFLITSCSLFFKSKRPETAKESEYQIKFSSPEWIRKNDERSDYVFENKKDGRILLSNSFCKEFQDQPLNQLATTTFKAIGNFKPNKEEYTTFHHREAYSLRGKGTVDGVPVELRLLNTRRNNCYFDFVGITPLASTIVDDKDFEEFIKSVEFK